MILTDGGTIQEKVPSLGKPVLVMRDTTGRPEGVKAGMLRLVGTKEEMIYEELTKHLDDQKGKMLWLMQLIHMEMVLRANELLRFAPHD